MVYEYEKYKISDPEGNEREHIPNVILGGTLVMVLNCSLVDLSIIQRINLSDFMVKV